MILSPCEQTLIIIVMMAPLVPCTEKKRIVRAKSVGGQLMRLFDDSHRLVQVVQRCDIDQIYGKGVVSYKVFKFWIHAYPFFYGLECEIVRDWLPRGGAAL